MLIVQSAYRTSANSVKWNVYAVTFRTPGRHKTQDRWGRVSLKSLYKTLNSLLQSARQGVCRWAALPALAGPSSPPTPHTGQGVKPGLTRARQALYPWTTPPNPKAFWVSFNFVYFCETESHTLAQAALELCFYLLCPYASKFLNVSVTETLIYFIIF